MLASPRLLVPFVVALLIGASAPAIAEDTELPAHGAAAEATIEPSAEPTEEPTVEPTDEPTTESSEAAPETPAADEPSDEPADEPTAEPTDEPSAKPGVTPTAQRPAAGRAKVTALSASVTDSGGFADALAACENGDVITLDADFAITSRFAIPCDLTLDLAGHDLDTVGFDITPGRHLTIGDSDAGGRLVATASEEWDAGIKVTDAQLTIEGGSVIAAGGPSAAGIGGGENYVNHGGNGGTITINGGNVTATGGGYAAGIGGAGWGAGGDITINGGNVTATGGISAAGIGSGYNRDFTRIRILGGQVRAVATSGSGIGSGMQAPTGPILIGPAAEVTVATTGRVLGATSGTPSTVPLQVDGTIRVESGVLNTEAGAITIGSTGAVLGPVGAPGSGPAVSGSGLLVNNGVLTTSSVAPGTRITNHHYVIGFDSAGGTAAAPITVLAPSLAAGLRALPTPTRTGYSLLGWERDGEPFAAGTNLGTGSSDGQPVEVELTARWGIATASDLATAVDTCSEDTVALDADITVASRLAVNCDVTLDLNGHTLATAGVDIAATKTFTIDDNATGGVLRAIATGTSPGIRVENSTLVIDGGTVRADGATQAAGIGSAQNGQTGSITINGGTVDARGSVDGFGGAGIGGGWGSTAPTILITGGDVTATGSLDGAGIGGGSLAPAGSVTITGGTVDATATVNAGSGIGGGWNSSGGVIDISGGTVTAQGANSGAGVGTGLSATAFTSLTIGAGADVTAIAGDGGSAVGYGGWSSTGGPHRPVQIDGTLRVPTGTLSITGLDLAIGETGRVLGTPADPTLGASLGGTGTIANGGVIALTNVASTVSVTGNHFAVVAPSGTTTVYGPSVQTGHRAMPADPTRGIDTFDGWTHEGDPFTATTTLPGTSTDGQPVEVELISTWNEGRASFDPADRVDLIANGDPVDVELSLLDGDGDPVAVDPADWDLTVPAELDLLHDADGWHLSGTAVGTHTISATTEVNGREYAATLEVTVQTGPVDELALSFTGIATQGETITMAVTASDAAGNDLGDVTDDITFTSSVATDVIDGNTITFPHASPHVITATHVNGATADLLIEVEPLLTPTPAEDDIDQPDGTDETDQPEATDEPDITDEAGKKDRTGGSDPKNDSTLTDTGSSMSPWWLASALALMVVGGGLVGRARRR